MKCVGLWNPLQSIAALSRGIYTFTIPKHIEAYVYVHFHIFILWWSFHTIFTKPRDNFGLVVVGGDLYAVGGSVIIGSQVGREIDDDD